MLEDKIIELAKTHQVKVFFDMDGVCAEYEADDGYLIKSNAPGFYFNKRPIYSIIETMKRLSETNNTEVLILSNCYFEEQKQDKINWLKMHAPFIKSENINIIKLHDEVYTPETKDFIKASYIEKLTQGLNAQIFFIEDDHGIIKATKKRLPHVKVNHVSTLAR